MSSIDRKFHETKIKVRLSETDALGIVYYSNYLVYFDVARLELLEELGLNKFLEENNLTFLCSEVRCKYLASLRLGDIISVVTYISKLGNTSVHYYHEIRKKDGTLAANGYVKDILVNKEMKPVIIPVEMRNALNKYLFENFEESFA